MSVECCRHRRPCESTNRDFNLTSLHPEHDKRISKVLHLHCKSCRASNNFIDRRRQQQGSIFGRVHDKAVRRIYPWTTTYRDRRLSSPWHQHLLVPTSPSNQNISHLRTASMNSHSQSATASSPSAFAASPPSCRPSVSSALLFTASSPGAHTTSPSSATTNTSCSS